MSDCPHCGKTLGLFDNKIECSRCKREFCVNGMDEFIIGINETMETTHAMNGRTIRRFAGEYVGVCSDCMKEVSTLLMAAREKDPEVKFGSCPKCGLGTQPTESRFSIEKMEWKNERVSGPMFCITTGCKACGGVFSRRYYWGNIKPFVEGDMDDPVWLNYALARYAETVERREDAAMHYEKAGLVEKAVEIRTTERNHHVDRPNLDISQLLAFLKENNYIIPYKCPSCNATIKISGNRNESKFFNCEYCGTGLQVIDVQNLIRDLM